MGRSRPANVTRVTRIAGGTGVSIRNIRKNRRGRNRYIATEMVFHAQRSFGPVTYTDREWLGLRTRCIWLLGHKVKCWTIKQEDTQ